MLALLTLAVGCGGAQETHAQAAPSATVVVATATPAPRPALQATVRPTRSSATPTSNSITVLLPLVAGPALDEAGDPAVEPSVSVSTVVTSAAVVPTVTDADVPTTTSTTVAAVPITASLAVTVADPAAPASDIGSVELPASAVPQPPLIAAGADADSPLAVFLTAVAAPVGAPPATPAPEAIAQAVAEPAAGEVLAPSVENPAENLVTTEAPVAPQDSEIVDALIVNDAISADLVTLTLEIPTDSSIPLTSTDPASVIPPADLEPQVEPPAAPVGPPPPMPLPNRTLLASDGVARTLEVPVLMYHYLSDPPPAANIYRVDLSVSPDRFAEHLDALRGAGYTTISLYDLYSSLGAGTPLPERPIVLTFDDGYRDVYINAFPRLLERGMTATFFVITDFIDAGREEYITWEMAREMQAAGLYIESHGRDHTTLQNREADYLVWQGLGSMETIQFELGVAPRFVSYPAGEYDDATIDVFRSAGYVAGLTTKQGDLHRSDDLFRLQRIRVRNTTTAADLLALLETDWSSVEEEE